MNLISAVIGNLLSIFSQIIQLTTSRKEPELVSLCGTLKTVPRKVKAPSLRCLKRQSPPAPCSRFSFSEGTLPTFLAQIFSIRFFELSTNTLPTSSISTTSFPTMTSLLKKPAELLDRLSGVLPDFEFLPHARRKIS